MNVNYVLSGQKGSPIAGSRNEDTVAYRGAASVPGEMGYTGDYQSVLFNREGGSGTLGPLYDNINKVDIAAGTYLSGVVATLSGSGHGTGIDAKAAAVTRYYYLGLTDDTVANQVNPLLAPKGRLMVNLASISAMTQVIAKDAANFRQVTITSTYDVQADNGGQGGSNKVIVWCSLAPPVDPYGQALYYIGTIDAENGSVIDGYSLSELLTRGPYLRANFQRAFPAKTVEAWGNSLVFIGGDAVWNSGPLSASVNTYDSTANLVQLRDAAGTAAADDPLVSGGVLQWQNWMIGQYFVPTDAESGYIITDILADDDGLNTVLELEYDLATTLSASAFKIVSRGQYVAITLPDPRVVDMVPALWELKTVNSELIGNPVAGKPMPDGQSFLLCGRVNMVTIGGVPGSVSLTPLNADGSAGLIGAVQGTIPYFGPLPSRFGACGAGCLCKGPGASILGFSANLGPWQVDVGSPVLIDPERRLYDFYESLTPEDYELCQAAWNATLQEATWIFPDTGKWLVWDMQNNRMLTFQEMDDVTLLCTCTFEQFLSDGDDMTTQGDVTCFGTDRGDIVDWNTRTFTDYYYPATDGGQPVLGATVTVVAADAITVNSALLSQLVRSANLTIIGRGGAASQTIEDRVGSSRPIASIVNGVSTSVIYFDASTSWSDGTPVVGDFVAIHPINVRWQSGDIRLPDIGRFSIQLVEGFIGIVPTNASDVFPVLYTTTTSGMAPGPNEASGEVVTFVDSLDIQNGRIVKLNPNDKGQSVRFQFEWWQPVLSGVPVQANRLDCTVG